MKLEDTIQVGGQAVVEGVMMRTPHSFAVAVRRANGEIVLRESPWRSLWDRFAFLRRPFLRGVLVLLETLLNGISAINFSAKIAMVDEAAEARSKARGKQADAPVRPEGVQHGEPDTQEVSDWAIWSTVILALGLGVAMFVALPHLAVWLGSLLVGRELSVSEILFHLIVGVVKFCVFIGYIALISLMQDIKRFFMYHGAEHQSIATYEARQELILKNARMHSPLHPRCGTTFLILVIAVSILVFSLVFPGLIWLVGEPTGARWLNQVLYIGIKLPLLLPIAGVAYELQRLSSRHINSTWAKILAWPGMFIQRMTTRPPSDEQLEVALTSLRKTLWQEQIGERDQAYDRGQQVVVFSDYDAVMREIPERSPLGG